MELRFDDLEATPGFFVTTKPERLTFLPEPERRHRRYTLISVDDHLVEPPHLFEGRVPARFADRGATRRARRRRHGVLGVRRPAALQGRAQRGRRSAAAKSGASSRRASTRCDAARGTSTPACTTWTSTASTRRSTSRRRSPGFAGQRYQLGVSDPDLALAVVRAANDWHLEEWAGTHPGRIIPCQVPWLLDPEVGAAEIRAQRRRAAFTAVTFPELPERLGLPSLHTGYWDPFLAACEETGTVVCLHVGSSSSAPTTSSDAPADTIGVLFFGWAMFAAVDWLYSKIPVRFPGPADLPVRGRHRLGRRAARPPRPRRPATRRCTALGRASTSRPREVHAAQLLVLRDRRPVGARAAAPHRRRPRAARVRLPAPGRHVARHPGAAARARSAASPPTTSASSRGRTRRSCSTFPVPVAVQADPDAY